MRDPRTLGPYQPQRLPSILDYLDEGGTPPVAAPAMVQAAAPEPGIASRIASLVGGGLASAAAIPFQIPQAIGTALQSNIDAARSAPERRAAELERLRLGNEAAQRQAQLEAAQLPAQEALAAAQARNQAAITDRLSSTTDPRLREALTRGAATGTFKPFDIEPGPAELAAYQQVLGMQEEEARQKLIAQREGRQAQLNAQLDRETTRQRFAGELQLEKDKRGLGPEPAKLSDIGPAQQRYLSQSQDFVKRRDSFQNIQFATQDTSGASDLTLLYNFIRLQDPNAVREGEIALAQNTASIPEKWVMQFKRVQAGHLLPADARAELIQQAQGIFRNSVRSQIDLEKGFGDFAIRNGLRPEDLTLGGALISPDLRRMAEPTAAEIRAELARRSNAGK